MVRPDLGQTRSSLSRFADPQASSTADLAWSRQAPLPHLTEAAQQQASASPERPPRHAALPDAPASSPDLHYFPVSLPRMFGYLTAPQELLTSYVEVPEIETVGVTKRGKRKVMPVEVRSFPENLRFKVADWPNEEIDLDRRGYDVIFACVPSSPCPTRSLRKTLISSFASCSLSVTKWIHLNSLNEGLLLFFTRCFETLLPGGRLILEPQPFSTYSKSARTSDQLKANLDKLRDGKGEERGWRSEDGDFEKILLDKIGFERKESLGETGKDGELHLIYRRSLSCVLMTILDRAGFRRPMEVYYKRGGSWL